MKEKLTAKMNAARVGLALTAALGGAPLEASTVHATESFNNRVAACAFDQPPFSYDINVGPENGAIGFQATKGHPTVLVGDPGVNLNIGDAYTRSDMAGFNPASADRIAVVAEVKSDAIMDLSPGHIWGRVCEDSDKAANDEVVSRVNDVFNKHPEVDEVDVVITDSKGFTVDPIYRGGDASGFNSPTLKHHPWLHSK